MGRCKYPEEQQLLCMGLWWCHTGFLREFLHGMRCSVTRENKQECKLLISEILRWFYFNGDLPIRPGVGSVTTKTYIKVRTNITVETSSNNETIAIVTFPSKAEIRYRATVRYRISQTISLNVIPINLIQCHKKPHFPVERQTTANQTNESHLNSTTSCSLVWPFGLTLPVKQIGIRNQDSSGLLVRKIFSLQSYRRSKWHKDQFQNSWDNDIVSDWAVIYIHHRTRQHQRAQHIDSKTNATSKQRKNRHKMKWPEYSRWSCAHILATQRSEGVVEIEIHSAVFNRLYLPLFFMKQVEISWLCLVIRTTPLT